MQVKWVRLPLERILPKLVQSLRSSGPFERLYSHRYGEQTKVCRALLPASTPDSYALNIRSSCGFCYRVDATLEEITRDAIEFLGAYVREWLEADDLRVVILASTFTRRASYLDGLDIPWFTYRLRRYYFFDASVLSVSRYGWNSTLQEEGYERLLCEALDFEVEPGLFMVEFSERDTKQHLFSGLSLSGYLRILVSRTVSIIFSAYDGESFIECSLYDK